MKNKTDSISDVPLDYFVGVPNQNPENHQMDKFLFGQTLLCTQRVGEVNVCSRAAPTVASVCL